MSAKVKCPNGCGQEWLEEVWAGLWACTNCDEEIKEAVTENKEITRATHPLFAESRPQASDKGLIELPKIGRKISAEEKAQIEREARESYASAKDYEIR